MKINWNTLGPGMSDIGQLMMMYAKLQTEAARKRAEPLKQAIDVYGSGATEQYPERQYADLWKDYETVYGKFPTKRAEGAPRPPADTGLAAMLGLKPMLKEATTRVLPPSTPQQEEANILRGLTPTERTTAVKGKLGLEMTGAEKEKRKFQEQTNIINTATTLFGKGFNKRISLGMGQYKEEPASFQDIKQYTESLYTGKDMPFELGPSTEEMNEWQWKSKLAAAVASLNGMNLNQLSPRDQQIANQAVSFGVLNVGENGVLSIAKIDQPKPPSAVEIGANAEGDKKMQLYDSKGKTIGSPWIIKRGEGEKEKRLPEGFAKMVDKEAVADYYGAATDALMTKLGDMAKVKTMLDALADPYSGAVNMEKFKSYLPPDVRDMFDSIRIRANQLAQNNLKLSPAEAWNIAKEEAKTVKGFGEEWNAKRAQQGVEKVTKPLESKGNAPQPSNIRETVLKPIPIEEMNERRGEAKEHVGALERGVPNPQEAVDIEVPKEKLTAVRMRRKQLRRKGMSDTEILKTIAKELKEGKL